MSAGDLTRIKCELGMVEGVRCEAGAFYEIPSAWLRELIHENDALHKAVADYHCNTYKEQIRSLEAEIERLRVVAVCPNAGDDGHLRGERSWTCQTCGELRG